MDMTNLRKIVILTANGCSSFAKIVEIHNLEVWALTSSYVTVQH